MREAEIRGEGRRSRRRIALLPWIAGVLGAVALLLAPTAALAKDEFERAFKRELGRIAAHEAVYAGRHVLGAILIGSHDPYGGYGPYSDCDAHHAHHHHGHHHHGVGHYRHVHRRHWHDRCDCVDYVEFDGR